MAGEFLRSKGIDIDATMDRLQHAIDPNETGCGPAALYLKNVILPSSSGATSTLAIENKVIERIGDSGSMPDRGSQVVDGGGALLIPSLCHPHIHIDKAYLLSHPRYAHLQVEKGDFDEAMTLTGKAKAQFERADLLERGQRVVDESVAAGVTHMRAFVEVDAGVRSKCVDAGSELKQRAAGDKSCHIQLCAFAQLPLFSVAQDDEDGSVIRGLMRSAAKRHSVDAIGSTPYVESDRQKMEKNVEWMIDLSIEHNLHLDFHLDYNLDPGTEPLIWHVIQRLHDKQWTQHTKEKTVVLGHCTRLALFTSKEWQHLAKVITDLQLPIHFVGLPTSDLFMMRAGRRPEVRGTLDVPYLIKEHKLNACLGINNIGNAFTPQGSCDPLSIASQGVAIYQAGTKKDAELLLECVSTRAKAAMGFTRRDNADVDLQVKVGDDADLMIFARGEEPHQQWCTRQSASEAVYLYDYCQGRRVIANGKVIQA